MPIEFRCPYCGQMLRTPDQSAGKHARCPQCRQVAPVPAPAPAPSPAFQLQPAAAPPSSTENPFGELTAPPVKPGEGEDANPYAAPGVYEAPPKAAITGPLAHRRIDLGEVLSAAWRIFTEELGKCLGVGGIAFAVSFGFGVLGQILGLVFQALAATENAVAIGVGVALFGLTIALQIVAQIWLHLGITLFAVKMARNRSGELSDLLAVGPYFARYLLLGILLFGLAAPLGMAALVGAPALLGYATGQEQGAAAGVGIGGLLFAVVATVVALTVFLATYFILDRDEGVFDALRSSARFMAGNRIATFGVLVLVGMGVFVFACFTCGLGRIATDPFTALVGAMIYLMATGQPHAAQAGPFQQF